jgi:hypothetical protein
MQLLTSPIVVEEATGRDGWIGITEDQTSFHVGGTLQMLDDCGTKVSFDQVNIYSDKRMTLGKDRVIRHIVFPFDMVRSGRDFTLYERIA